MAAFDFMGSTNPQTGQFQLDPNFLRALAQVGTNLGQGKGAGESLGTAATTLIGNRAAQENVSPMLQNMQDLQQQQKLATTPQLSVSPQLKVTPKGQPGPDSITTKQTADGLTTTIQEPSTANLTTYGTSVPPESISNQQMMPQGGGATSPFWQALLSNRR